MTYIQKYTMKNGKELYRIYIVADHYVRCGYCTLEEVLYILSTKEQ